MDCIHHEHLVWSQRNLIAIDHYSLFGAEMVYHHSLLIGGQRSHRLVRQVVHREELRPWAKVVVEILDGFAPDRGAITVNEPHLLPIALFILSTYSPLYSPH